MKTLTAALLLASALTGCTRYEYEEEFRLEVDGSGDVRISGSRDLFDALYGIERAREPELAVKELRNLFDSPELEVLSVTQSSREDRTYLHVLARFENLNRLAQHSAFQGRKLRIEPGADELRLVGDIAGLSQPPLVSSERRGGGPEGLMAFRFHFPSPVRSHNAKGGVERGNILAWEQKVADHFTGKPIHIEAWFDRRTVLAVTMTLFGVAAGLVFVVVTAALIVLVRIGRRQISSETVTTSAQGRSSS